MRIEILSYLKSGASLVEGIRLFSLLHSEQHPFLLLLRSHPEQALPILIQELARRIGLNPEELRHRPKFREEWRFLNQPDCPTTLKILASDKIAAYHRYCQAHAMLFDCTSSQEQHQVARQLIADYLENQRITAEFKHYRDHGSILGQHPVFKWTKQLQQIKSMNPIKLLEFRNKLEHNIWRIQAELAKQDKPHLRTQREQRLKFKQLQFTEAELIIKKISS